MAFMKDWKEKIKNINRVEGLNLEIADTNRRNYVILKSGNLRFLVSYRSLVALSVGNNYYINSCYTKENSRKGVSACSPTTNKHLSLFCTESHKHWSGHTISDFADDAENIPFLRQLKSYFNISGYL